MRGSSFVYELSGNKLGLAFHETYCCSCGFSFIYNHGNSSCFRKV